MEEEQLGKVFVAPNVLVTIARLTALSVPGVARMSPGRAGGVNRLLGRTGAGDGVRIEVEDDVVSVDLYIIVEGGGGTDMLRLSRQIQAKVTRAIKDMVGMPVKEVNVHIQDVESPPETG